MEQTDHPNGPVEPMPQQICDQAPGDGGQQCARCLQWISPGPIGLEHLVWVHEQWCRRQAWRGSMSGRPTAVRDFSVPIE